MHPRIDLTRVLTACLAVSLATASVVSPATASVVSPATASGGSFATASGGSFATASGGSFATASGGSFATASGGSFATASGGSFATASGESFATASGGSLATAAADARETRTITGRIDATGCGLDVAPTAIDDAAAARTTRCLGEGKPAILRDEASSDVYLATFAVASPADRERWIALPGKRVRVTGTVSEQEGMRMLAVERLRVEHDHGAAPHGGVVGMVGEHHLELVVTPEGEIRVYLLDAFLDPITATGVVGGAVVTGKDRVQRAAPVRVADGSAFLRIDTAPRKGDRDVTVTFTAGPIPPTSMNLPFPDTGSAPDTCPHHPGKH